MSEFVYKKHLEAIQKCDFMCVQSLEHQITEEMRSTGLSIYTCMICINKCKGEQREEYLRLYEYLKEKEYIERICVIAKDKEGYLFQLERMGLKCSFMHLLKFCCGKEMHDLISICLVRLSGESLDLHIKMCKRFWKKYCKRISDWSCVYTYMLLWCESVHFHPDFVGVCKKYMLVTNSITCENLLMKLHAM